MFKKIAKWFEGKKRRISIISLTFASIDPEPYSKAALTVVGVLFGGADMVEVAVKLFKNQSK